jgi:hypothetical protein
MRIALTVVGTALIGLGGVTPVDAQASSAPGFLLGTPIVALSVHGGFDAPSAGGDVFGFVTNTLTLRSRDFRAPGVRVDVAVAVLPQTDLVLSFGYAASKTQSEYRNFVDNANQPINQTTSFRRTPVMASIKQYLTPKGRSIGRYAWIPARIAPYVGVGGGLLYYEFEQSGDFIDYQTNRVFNSNVASNDWVPVGHAFVGTDVTLSPRYALTFDARYTRGHARPAMGFASYDRIDLSGVATTLGLTVRF